MINKCIDTFFLISSLFKKHQLPCSRGSYICLSSLMINNGNKRLRYLLKLLQDNYIAY